jgi:hypothetical protein
MDWGLRRALVMVGAEPLSPATRMEPGGERLAGVVRLPLPASGSKRGDCLSAVATLQWRMSELTRRRSLESPDECWQVFYGDVRVGTIAIRTGIPPHEQPWG